MAGSALQLSYDDFQLSVGDLLNYGRATGSTPDAVWSAEQLARADKAIQNGYRRFLKPINGHNWSFLTPSNTTSTVASYSTGTVTITADAGGSIVTGASTVFPSWAADGHIKISGTWYSVKTRSSDTGLILDDVSLTADALTTYTLGKVTYALPDDFMYLDGSIWYTSGGLDYEIVTVGEQYMFKQRMSDSQVARPRYAAIRPIETMDATVGQRFEMTLTPTPDAVYLLFYTYAVMPEDLDTTDKYPLGGMMHSQTIEAAIMAEAEKLYQDNVGIYENAYQQLLAGSIALDKRQNPQTFGSLSTGGRRNTGNTYPSVSYDT